MSAPPDALLRTLAAVPPAARVVDVGGGAGETAEALARLGFDVWTVDPDPDHVEVALRRLGAVVGEDEAARRVTRAAFDALGFPDGWTDWAVLTAPPLDVLEPAVAEAARVLRPGGWLWVQARTDAEQLDQAAAAAGLLPAEEPRVENGATHAIYRRPGGVG